MYIFDFFETAFELSNVFVIHLCLSSVLYCYIVSNSNSSLELNGFFTEF